MTGPTTRNIEPLAHDAAATADAVTRDEKAPGAKSATRWIEMLAEAKRNDDRYHALCDKIDKLYSDLEALAADRTDRQFQIFWANLEVLRPSIYARPPVPVVTSRFRDRKDLPRKAADVLERALIADIEADDLHDTLILARDDLAVSSRGVAWVEMRDRDGIDVPSVVHVDRKDFRHGAARKWHEVPWVAKREWLTRKQWAKRFPDAKSAAAFEKRDDATGKFVEGERKAEVWEIWHKEDDTVVWVSSRASEVLDERKPEERLAKVKGFFPCPRPVYGTLKRASLTPVPDFVYYRDQVEEINEMTGRIAALTDALKMRGFYASGTPEIGTAIETAMASLDERAILIPISSMAALGGQSLKDSIIWLPVRDIAEVIVQLIALRQQLIQDVYEITGLSDIMRGSTEAQETLGAQQLKAQYGSVRIRERQSEMVRLARDVIRLKAEVMAEEMTVETLLTMAQVEDIPSKADLEQQAAPIKQQLQGLQQQAMAAMEQAAAVGDQQAGQAAQQQAQEAAGPLMQQLQELEGQVTREALGELLRDQKLRPFVLDVETDSTIEPDQMAEKQNRIEFTGAMGPMLQQSLQAMQLAGAAAPQLGAFLAEGIRFAASGFKVQRAMDEAIDNLAEGFADFQPPQPEVEDPAAAEAAQQAEAAKAQAAQQAADAKAQESQVKLQAMQAQMQVDAQKAQLEIVALQQEMRFSAQRHDQQMALLTKQLEKSDAEVARAVPAALAAKQEPRNGKQ